MTLRACDLAIVSRRGSASISFFDPGENRYGDIVEPEDGIEVRLCDLVVTRAERGLGIRAPEQLIEQRVRENRLFASCHAMPPPFPSSWPKHEIPDTPA